MSPAKGHCMIVCQSIRAHGTGSVGSKLWWSGPGVPFFTSVGRCGGLGSCVKFVFVHGKKQCFACCAEHHNVPLLFYEHEV